MVIIKLQIMRRGVMDKVVLIFCLVFLSSCSIINGWLGLEDDNFAEELVEDFIDMETGLDVDLTPSSKEKN